MDNQMTEGRILQAFRRLSELLKERDIQGEICLLGGTVMVLAFKARPSTKDVDAIFHPTQVIRELSHIIRKEQELPENWINDAAKGYVSAEHEVINGDLPQFESLRLTAPTPEYLLAMKCMASRIPSDPGDRGDIPDIQFLIHHLGLTLPSEVMEIVGRYYPANQIPARARFIIEDIFAELGGNS
jgi:hypothetical protein